MNFICINLKKRRSDRTNRVFTNPRPKKKVNNFDFYP